MLYTFLDMSQPSVMCLNSLRSARVGIAGVRSTGLGIASVRSAGVGIAGVRSAGIRIAGVTSTGVRRHSREARLRQASLLVYLIMINYISMCIFRFIPYLGYSGQLDCSIRTR